MENKHLSKLEKVLRNFYRRMLGYLIQEDSFQIVVKAIKDMFVIFHRKYIDVKDENLREIRAKWYKTVDWKQSKIEVMCKSVK